MNEKQTQQVENCIEQLEQGTLTGQQLRDSFEALAGNSDGKRQDLLYLQTERSSPCSKVIGMMMIENGQRHDGAADADEWPYQTVLEAMADGWRVVSFPNLALMALNHNDSHGLEFEFILER